MPPPSLSTTTITRGTPRRRRPIRALVSWRNATSPVSSTVGVQVSATPTAVEVTPSMPLAPRLATTRTSSRAGANHSRSRTGMDDDTTSTPSAGTAARASSAVVGSVATPPAPRASSRVRRAVASASAHARVHSAGAGSVRAPASWRHTSAGSAGRDHDSTWSGSGTRPWRSMPTWTAPLRASHSPRTRDECNAPRRSTNSGRWAAANPSWRRRTSAVVTTRGWVRRQPDGASASTGQPRVSARASTASASAAVTAVRAPATMRPRRFETAASV